VRGDGQRLRQLALAEDLHVPAQAANEPRPLQRLEGHLSSSVEDALQLADVHALRERPVWTDRHRVLGGGAALLAEPHVQRHLAALEPRAHPVRAGAGLLALEAAPGVAALAGAETAADALARAALLRGRQIGEVDLGGQG